MKLKTKPYDAGNEREALTRMAAKAQGMSLDDFGRWLRRTKVLAQEVGLDADGLRNQILFEAWTLLQEGEPR